VALSSFAFFNSFFGIPYPYEKLDIVGIPDFAAGAMENAGAITFRERLLLADEATASLNVRKAVASVIAHELAHVQNRDILISSVAATIAAAIMIASEEAAKRNVLTSKARVLGAAVAGVPPRIMGIGPAPATQKVLQLTGLKLDQIDVIELNEAFAAQGLAVLRLLGLKDDDSRVNINGGAIALGHPLGASGARLATTAINQLHKGGGRYALCTMCIGVGQGIAVILERV